ncbi:P pilus assembly protein, chaperone PapD [Moorella thermoacetica Y72]|uniref:P pilus assembly protein, chaperone PapD n=1 Tax=Moorella thermoacetica Y72 TaxID=1325331 RepID=A0A0S6UGT7_NEOTH|nr:P pilus assembly protein, chaperone PapD [Moorella thermoacetica Y72]
MFGITYTRGTSGSPGNHNGNLRHPNNCQTRLLHRAPPE